MPYKDPEKQKKFQREWLQKRRERVFKGKKCKYCGSTKNLVLHHRDSNKKVDHRIWSWAPERFMKELKKCDIVCQSCNNKKENQDNR